MEDQTPLDRRISLDNGLLKSSTKIIEDDENGKLSEKSLHSNSDTEVNDNKAIFKSKESKTISVSNSIINNKSISALTQPKKPNLKKAEFSIDIKQEKENKSILKLVKTYDDSFSDDKHEVNDIIPVDDVSIKKTITVNDSRRLSKPNFLSSKNINDNKTNQPSNQTILSSDNLSAHQSVKTFKEVNNDKRSNKNIKILNFITKEYEEAMASGSIEKLSDGAKILPGIHDFDKNTQKLKKLDLSGDSDDYLEYFDRSHAYHP